MRKPSRPSASSSASFASGSRRRTARCRSLVGARVGSLSLLVLAALATRSGLHLTRRDLPAVALLGVLDTAANGLFVLASARGYLSIVSVLGSLYPVVTVLAAHLILGERISRTQRWGVAVALAGVAVVASG